MKTTATLMALIALVACAEQEPAVDDTRQDPAITSAPTPPIDTANSFVDPNSATENQLAMAGLDSAQAARLIAGRPYTTMLEVDSVLQLDSARAEQFYARVWMPIDLNTASGEEILLIPGVGARMRHEFEEYRPYTAIEQFRREIGKYVDEAEVARLERYVTIRS